MNTVQPGWWTRSTLRVVFSSRPPEDLQAGDLLVGVYGSTAADRVVLYHKAQAVGAGAVGCVSDLVVQADPTTRGAWQRCFPQGMAGVRRLLVEDASLDTCMALLLFAAAVSPDPKAEAGALGAAPTMAADATRRDAWLAYVRAWEAGQYLDGADKQRSLACQLSALAHALMASGRGPGLPPDDTSVGTALRACLVLLDAFIGCNTLPRDATAPSGLAEAAWAGTQLEFERQEYLLALKHGVRTQLRLPLAQGGRRVLVDALFVTDLALTGTLKVLARTDREHSWTRQGFAVLGVHRPALAGSGSDMTLSVDPATGLSLEALWLELERLEDQRWAGQRPRDQPRNGIHHYSDPASGKALTGAPNEPWYDERGRYTILAAPHALANQQPGTRLDWHADVLPAVWRLYPPFDVHLQIADLTPAGSRHRVVVATWPRGVASAAGRTDALHQWLASLSAPGPHQHPGEFVPLRALQVVSLAGGDVIVHPQGLTIFDDWNSRELATPELRAAAVELARIAQDYDTLLHDPALTHLFERQQAVRRAPQQAGLARVSALRELLLDLKGRFTQLQGREAALPQTPGLLEVSEAVSRTWATPQSRGAVIDSLQRLDDDLQQARVLREERRQFLPAAIVSVAGLFVVLRDGVAAVGGYFTANRFELALAAIDKAKLDPAVLKTLQDSSELSDRIDALTLVAMALVFLAGALIAWRAYFGTGPR